MPGPTSRCSSDWPDSAAARPSSPPIPDRSPWSSRPIDRLEKSPVRGTVHTRYRETFLPWVGLALGLAHRATASWWPGGSAGFHESMSSRRPRVDDLSERLNPRGVMAMSFANPEYLWLLVGLVPLAGWMARGRRRRRRDWDALGQSGRPRGDGSLGWLGAIACLVVALAQPRWGRVLGPPLPPGHDVVLLVDVSRSMGAEDAVPNRLGVAVEAARSLVAALGREGGNRVAVVAFAGRGVVRCPLTENLGAVDSALQALRPGDVRPGGTDLGAALVAALEAFDDQEHEEGRTIVLFSDGEDHGQNWEANVNRLRQARVIVHSIAIGDRETGHPVPSGRDGEFLTYGGAPVLSRRSDRRLQDVSKATGGVVVPLGLATVDLGVLYDTRIARAEVRQRAATRSLERAERFPLFVLAALVFGLAGSSPLGGRRGWPRLLVVAVSVAAIGAGKGEESAALASPRAERRTHRGDSSKRSPPSSGRSHTTPTGRSRYDAAATLYQLGRYSDALVRYREARERAGPGLRTKIDYALGNTSLALGDVAAALRHYDACLASTVRGALRRGPARRRDQPSVRRRTGSPPLDSTRRWRRPTPAVASLPVEAGRGWGNVPGTLRSDGVGPSPGGRVPVRRPTGRRGAGGAGGAGRPLLDRARPRPGWRH